MSATAQRLSVRFGHFKSAAHHNHINILAGTFQDTTGSTAVNRTAVSNYQAYVCLSGFIVGLPTIPEIGTDAPAITCYDLACSNCFRDRSVTKALTLQQGGKAHCTSCQRTYDLNNIGQVTSGNAGINLFRYRVYYGNNTLSVNNR